MFARPFRPIDTERRLNPFVRLPYEVAGFLATGASRLVPGGSTGKLRRSLTGRRGALDRVTDWGALHRDLTRPLLWMHAPSVGEGLMAKPVLERLRARRPDLQFAYTWFSPSAEAFAATLGADVADYLPFDTGHAARAMLDALRPSALVFSKLDVWPLLAEEAARRGVAVALTSAALSAASGRRGVLARWLLSDAYGALAAAGAASEDDANRLAGIGVRRDRITVTGDTRYDQVWARARGSPVDADLLTRLAAARPTVVAGSTWPADEAVIFESWHTVRRECPDARLIIAPHEPDAPHLGALGARVSAAGHRAVRLSEAGPETDVIIVDRTGVLADLYALADVAYVGGGFHAAGLHSVVEPAAHGVPVFFGPRHEARRDAAALAAAGGGFAITDVASLAARTVALLGDPATRAAAGEKARSVVAAGLGAAERSAALVERLLPAAPRPA